MKPGELDGTIARLREPQIREAILVATLRGAAEGERSQKNPDALL